MLTHTRILSRESSRYKEREVHGARAWGLGVLRRPSLAVLCDSPPPRVLPPRAWPHTGSTQAGRIQSWASSEPARGMSFSNNSHYLSSGSKLCPRHHSKALHGFYRKEDNDIWKADNEAPPNPPPSHSPRETNPKTSAPKNCLQWETFKWPETKSFSPATSHWSFLSFRLEQN